MMKRFQWSLLLLGLLCVPLLGGAQQTLNPIREIPSVGNVLSLQPPYLYMGEATGLRIFDISNPAAPTQVGLLPTDYPIWSIGVMGTVAVLGLETGSDLKNLLIVNVADVTKPAVLFERHLGGEGVTPRFIHPLGSNLFIGLDDGTLVSTSLTAQNDLVQISTLTLNSPITNVVGGAGTTAYVSTNDYIYELNLSDPNNMQILDEEQSYDFNNDLDLDGTILAVAEGAEGLTFYDVSVPGTLTRLKSENPGFRDNDVSSVDLRQEYAYVGVLFASSRDVTVPPIPGSMQVLDYKNFDNIQTAARFNADADLEESIYDVVAYNGYEYALADTRLLVFEHGPKGDVRPTETPVVLTPTPTGTATPTATVTPPILATATRPGGATATPTGTPGPAGTPTPSSTPGPDVTPTPGGEEPTPIFAADFDGATLADESFTAQLPFGGTFVLGTAALGTIPTDATDPDATNGTGLSVTVQPGQAVMLLGNSQPLPEPMTLLFRVKVRTTGVGAAIALAAVDLTDGTVFTNQPGSSVRFADGYESMVMLYQAPSNSVAPILQVAAGGTSPVTVYFDNFEIWPVQPGAFVSAEMLGVEDNSPQALKVHTRR